MVEIGPEEGGEIVGGVFWEVVGDDQGEGGDESLAVVGVEEVVEALDEGLAVDTVVELAQEGEGLLCAGLAYAGGAWEEEVVAGIGGRGEGGIEDGEVADAGEDEVLEDGGGGCGRGEDEDAGGLEGILAGGSPETGGGEDECGRGGGTYRSWRS